MPFLPAADLSCVLRTRDFDVTRTPPILQHPRARANPLQCARALQPYVIVAPARSRRTARLHTTPLLPSMYSGTWERNLSPDGRLSVATRRLCSDIAAEPRYHGQSVVTHVDAANATGRSCPSSGRETERTRGSNVCMLYARRSPLGSPLPAISSFSIALLLPSSSSLTLSLNT